MPYRVLFLKNILAQKKIQNGRQKSKMAATKISFYRFAPQEWINVMNSKKRKVSSLFAGYLEKKSSKSDHFWVSYGPCKKWCNWWKTCFSWISPWNRNILILLKEQILFRSGFCIWVANFIKIYWELMEKSTNNYFRSALLKFVKNMAIGALIVHFVIKARKLVEMIGTVYRIQG